MEREGQLLGAVGMGALERQVGEPFGAIEPKPLNLSLALCPTTAEEFVVQAIKPISLQYPREAKMGAL